MILSDKDLLVFTLVLGNGAVSPKVEAGITKLRNSLDALEMLGDEEGLAGLKILTLGLLNDMQENMNNVRGWCNAG